VGRIKILLLTIFFFLSIVFSVNAQNNQIQFTSYTSTYNPLFLIRNNELKIFTASKMPVGVYLKMNDFTMQEIQLQKDDKLYLFIDGYADQFGGVGRKKFILKNFKDLLLQINNTSMLDKKKY